MKPVRENSTPTRHGSPVLECDDATPIALVRIAQSPKPPCGFCSWPERFLISGFECHGRQPDAGSTVVIEVFGGAVALFSVMVSQ